MYFLLPSSFLSFFLSYFLFFFSFFIFWLCFLIKQTDGQGKFRVSLIFSQLGHNKNIHSFSTPNPLCLFPRKRTGKSSHIKISPKPAPLHRHIKGPVCFSGKSNALKSISHLSQFSISSFLFPSAKTFL